MGDFRKNAPATPPPEGSKGMLPQAGDPPKHVRLKRILAEAHLKYADAGVPDLLCILPKQGRHPAIIKLLEAKRRPNKPTSEQQKLIDMGASVAVYSVADAMAALGEL